MHKIEIIGYLGQDARIIETETSTFIAFSVAVNESYNDKNGQKITRTIWYDITSNAVKVAPYLTKGKQVFIEGSPSINTYTDRAGEQRASIQIRAQRIQLLSAGRASADKQPQPTKATAAAQVKPPTPPQPQLDDDLPF
jgi:single-strand DNA-binding protein